MSTLRFIAATSLTGLLCSGCGTQLGQSLGIAIQGRPEIADATFMLNGASHDTGTNSQNVDLSDLPAACQEPRAKKAHDQNTQHSDGDSGRPTSTGNQEVPKPPAPNPQGKQAETNTGVPPPSINTPGLGGDTGSHAPKSDKDGPDTWVGGDYKDDIRACTIAMKQLIDIRWARFTDALHGSISYGSTFLDAMSMGLNAAGTLTPGDTSQILSGVAGGFTGLKATINEDILYKNSIHMILQQMEKDRALRATIITIKLSNNAYPSMMDAASDLYAYHRAGTWTNALVAMQADSGNKLAECKAQLRKLELTAATTSNGKLGADQVNVTNDPCSTTSKQPPAALIENTVGSVTFDKDKDALPANDDGKKAIAEAAARFVNDKYTGILITGQADEAEKNPTVLSLSRAQKVMTALVDALRKKETVTHHIEAKGIGVPDPASSEASKNQIVTITLTKDK